MEIVFVSTFNTRCGIADYTKSLAEEMIEQGHNVCVLSEKDPFASGVGAPKSKIIDYPIWHRRIPLKIIADTILSSKVKPDVCHFQHEYGLFPNTTDFFNVLQKLIDNGIKVVTTLHTVRSDYCYDFPGDLIVHSPDAALFAPKSYIIPHGVYPKPISEDQRRKAREALKIPTPVKGKVILVPGFVNPSKGIGTILDIFIKHCSGHLIISGDCGDDNLRNYLHNKTMMSGRGNDVRLDLTYADDIKRDLYFKAADLIILGRQDSTPYSASGQIATAIGYGLPVIAKETQIHRDPAVLLFRQNPEENELADFLIHINDTVLKALSARSYKAALEREWGIVAKMHEEVYSK